MAKTDEQMTEPVAVEAPIAAPAPVAKDGGERGPVAVFDPERRLYFALDSLGRRVYHDCPSGFQFDAEGLLSPVDPAKSGQVPAGDTL